MYSFFSRSKFNSDGGNPIARFQDCFGGWYLCRAPRRPQTGPQAWDEHCVPQILGSAAACTSGNRTSMGRKGQGGAAGGAAAQGERRAQICGVPFPEARALLRRPFSPSPRPTPRAHACFSFPPPLQTPPLFAPLPPQALLPLALLSRLVLLPGQAGQVFLDQFVQVRLGSAAARPPSALHHARLSRDPSGLGLLVTLVPRALSNGRLPAAALRSHLASPKSPPSSPRAPLPPAPPRPAPPLPARRSLAACTRT
jgi:hypothetical protein